ncbi:flavodoxin family protein [Nonomuraea dietziae]|uniref:flavodoxin family protein n=1 Tax=Nonomuraea dietziae TaxID=65515 RepID=UPI00343DBD92
MAERRFLFLIGSARPGGNTEALARTAAEHLPEGAEQRWLHLDDLPLPPFRDVRHADDGVYRVPVGNERVLLEATLDATDLVIASPLYWYSVSASTKLYLDYWSAWMRVPGVDFRRRMAGKTTWAISAVSDDDMAVADPLVGTLRLCAQYFGGRWGGALLGFANRPGEMATDHDALTRAKTFFTARATG